MPGTFIVLEGPDASGTSLHSKLLAERFTSEGKKVLLTAEPTEGEHGRAVVDALHAHTPPSAEEIQKMFCLDRADHVEQLIQPALDEGKIVVCDRYVPSTIIYGEASGVDRAELEKWNVPFPKPDVLIITLPPYEICQERLARRKGHDAFEKDAFQRIVYAGYEKYAEDHPEAIVVDTAGGKDEVAEHIYMLVGGIGE